MLSQRGAMAARSLLRASGRQSQGIFSRNLGVGQKRVITTEPLSQSTANDILASQRLKRPISPHLTIYQPQLTWYMSMSHRITGLVISGPFYLFALAYLISPTVGWHLESQTLAKKFGDLPSYVKGTIKGVAAFPFTYHCWNGVRHLVWDTARELTVRGVYRTGYAVLGLSAVSTLALVAL